MTLGRTLVKSRASSGTQLLRVCLRCFSWFTEHLEKKSCSTCFRWLSVHFSNWGKKEEGLSIYQKQESVNIGFFFTVSACLTHFPSRFLLSSKTCKKCLQNTFDIKIFDMICNYAITNYQCYCS